MADRVETVVIGGGQAGLAMSWHLKQLGREHLVLERARVAERWRSERWESLAFQFPNRMMRLPGYAYEGSDPDAFMGREGVVAFIQEYARRLSPPIRTSCNVRRLFADDAGRFGIEWDGGSLQANSVVIATGPYQDPKIPAFAGALPGDIHQVTANRYFNPDGLPAGAVLVVGSGASGCQIAEDLLDAGRRVHLSVRRHRRVPRRYRGRDFALWQEALGVFDRIVDDPGTFEGPPLITGAGGGHDMDLRALADRGAVLLGSLLDISGGRLKLAADLERHLAAGDEWFDRFKQTVDAHVRSRGLEAPIDSAPVAPRTPQSSPVDLALRRAGITSVIWCLGYAYDFRWVDLAAFDEAGRPVHTHGVANVPGLYFLGLPRLRKVKSSFLWGAGEDAQYLAERMAPRATLTAPA